MYVASDNYLGPTAYVGPGPNDDGFEVDPDDLLIQWRGITLHGRVGVFTITDWSGWEDLPDARTQWDPRPNAHGMFDAPVLSAERHVLVSGWCIDNVQRNELMQELQAAMGFQPHAETMTVHHAGRRLSAAARLVRFAMPDLRWRSGYFAWTAEWVCPDPYRYGPQVMEYTTLPNAAGTGLQFDLFTDGESRYLPRTDPPPPGPEAPPLAPTWLGPMRTIDRSLPVFTAEWQHNPVDGSDQRRWEVQYRSSSAPTWATVGPVNSASQIFPAPTSPDWYEVQVRTWGDAEDPSPWSEILRVEIVDELPEHWLDFGDTPAAGRVTLTNDGTAPAWPRFEVRGPALDGFTITNVETGNRIVFNGSIPVGSTLTIESAVGTAFLDGADRSGRVQIREWTSVPPGGSYTFQFSAPTFSAASLVAAIRPTYW